jgi:hypothetical protein
MGATNTPTHGCAVLQFTMLATVHESHSNEALKRSLSTSGQLLALFAGDTRRCVIVVEAFLDESGTHGNSPVVCVAGYMGEHEEWKRFEECWDPILRSANIDCFHAKEPRCDPLRPHLVECLKKSKIRGRIVSVGVPTYKHNVAHGAKSVIGNAYAACAFACAGKIGTLAKERNLGPVAFVIEDGQPNVEYVRATLERLIGNDDFNVASVAVAKKRDFVPLQAADFLAHVFGTNQSDWFPRLLGDGEGMALHGHYKGEQLKQLSEGVEEIKRLYRYRKQQAKRAAKRGRKI